MRIIFLTDIRHILKTLIYLVLPKQSQMCGVSTIITDKTKMKIITNKSLILTLAISLFQLVKVNAQEFSIATGSDTTFVGGGAFDGTNFLVGIVGDSFSKDNVTAQLFSSSGTLIGSRISIGKKGGNAQVAFDGTNYLLVWTGYNWNPFNQEPYDTTSIFGQFISPSGNLAGTSFAIETGISRKHSGSFAFNDTTYLLTYLKGGNHTNYLYGQRISKTGTLIAAPIQISNNYAREGSMAYDGTNYLVTWVEGSGFPNDKEVYGQFLSKTGLLIGSNFIIDGGVGLSDNPTAVAFDGSRYLVAFHEQAVDTISRWNLFARFVSTVGTVDPNRITVCDSTQYPMLPSVAFDGTNYLLTWVNMFSPETLNSIQIKGRFFNTLGLPIDTAFSIFGTIGNKFPVGGVAGFVNNQYLIGAVRLDSNFTDGDIYGKFLASSVLGIKEIVKRNTFFNLFPNPALDIVSVSFDNVSNNDINLKVYDAQGTLVKSKLLKQYQQQINISDLSNGIYIVEIKSKEWTGTQKLIIQR